MARWIIDKAAKNYLRACWRLRSAVLGEVRVEHKRLVHKPSTLPIAELVARQAGCGPTDAPSMEHRQFWLEWAPGPRDVSDRRERHRSRTRKPFFAVWSDGKLGSFAAGVTACAVWQIARTRGFMGTSPCQRPRMPLLGGHIALDVCLRVRERVRF